MIAWFAGHPLGLKIVLGGLGALLLFFSLWLLWLRKYLEWQNVKTLEIEERVALKIEFIKTGAQIVGGLFFILTILVAYWNYQVSQKNLEATQKKNEADLEQAREKQVTELYVKAIGQLGSNKLPVILGGIYALERIARDSKKDKGPILEVLTAYVRENAPWPPEDPGLARKRRPWTNKGRKVASQTKALQLRTAGKTEKGQESRNEPDTDIQAVLTVIGRLGPAYDKKGKPQRLDLGRTDLWGAHLREAHIESAFFGEAHLERSDLDAAHLEGTEFREAHLERANLRAAHLEDADLIDSHLEGAYLNVAHLEKAKLIDSHMEGAFLPDAHLEGAKLGSAHLEGAYLMEAHLEGARLNNSHLEGASLYNSRLEGATLYGAHLEQADLRGADLRDAIDLTQAQIDAAYCDEETQLPPGLKPSGKKKPAP